VAATLAASALGEGSAAANTAVSTAVSTRAVSAATATGSIGRATDAAAPALPELTVSTLVDGLTNPWDLEFTPDGTLIYDVRDGGLGAVLPGGEARTMTADFSDNFVGNESGAMGIAVDPDYARNRNIYVCQTLRGPNAGTPGVGSRNAVVKWRIGADYRSATRVRTIVDGLLPVPLPTDPEASQGRHVGCRLRFDGAGLLYISVGDGRTPTGPEDITSPMGKVLRVTTTGQPAPGNPFASNADSTAQMIFSYGHRNPWAWPCSPAPGGCRRTSTARTSTTRSTCCPQDRTTAGTRSDQAGSTRTTALP
jgi:glucose/arabinose dehydrogenase